MKLKSEIPFIRESFKGISNLPEYARQTEVKYLIKERNEPLKKEEAK